MREKLRIVYAGTPDFAVPALQALHQSPHKLVAVFTQPDRPAGRGLGLHESAIKKQARVLEIPVFQPATLRIPEARGALHELCPDLLIVAAYGLILPQDVLDLPRLACVNIHASLLPRWRGAAPIQRAIAAGDTISGVSIMQMEAGLDTGPVYLARTTPIADSDTGGSLHDRLADLGAAALLEALPGIADGSLRPTAQDAARASHAPKIAKGEARIDWTRSACEIERQVRAFDPWPVCDTLLDGHQIRIWAASIPAPPGASPPRADTGRHARAAPGTVLAAQDRLLVATGDGVLQIDRLQPAGKRAMETGAFLNARRGLEGKSLG